MGCTKAHRYQLAVCPLCKLEEKDRRIKKLEDERQQWLEWNERKGPGLEAYREQGQRIEKLEGRLAETQQRNGGNIAKLEAAEQRIEELERELKKAREPRQSSTIHITEEEYLEMIEHEKARLATKWLGLEDV